MAELSKLLGKQRWELLVDKQPHGEVVTTEVPFNAWAA